MKRSKSLKILFTLSRLSPIVKAKTTGRTPKTYSKNMKYAEAAARPSTIASVNKAVSRPIGELT